MSSLLTYAVQTSINYFLLNHCKPETHNDMNGHVVKSTIFLIVFNVFEGRIPILFDILLNTVSYNIQLSLN